MDSEPFIVYSVLPVHGLYMVKLDLIAMLVFMTPNSWVIHEIINIYISGCDSIQGIDFLEFSWPMKSMYIVSWPNMAHI